GRRGAGERARDKRLTALSNRLLVEAEEQKFPLPLLTPPVESATKLDWRRRFDVALTDALQSAEQVWVRPTGTRRVLQTVLVVLGNTLPTVALLGGLFVIIFGFFGARHRPGDGEFVFAIDHDANRPRDLAVAHRALAADALANNPRRVPPATRGAVAQLAARGVPGDSGRSGRGPRPRTPPDRRSSL